MKYIAQPDGMFAAIDETAELFAQLSALPKESRPVFLAESSKEVKDYFAAQAAAQAEASNLAQAKAIEREAIDEVIREQFAKQIAERAEKKKAKLEKQRKG